MSRASAERSIRELESITTELLWRQWRAVGGSAASAEPWHSIVDPEALVLASLFVEDREPRISDILLSWVELNAPLLSVQRLKNLQKLYPREVTGRVAKFVAKARFLHKQPRWRRLSPDDDDEVAHFGSHVSRAARVSHSTGADLLLRLRSAMGVGVKPDVLTVVLGRDRPVTVRDLSELLGYTAVGTRSAVLDLSRSGFIFGVGGRPAAYSSSQKDWQSLLRLRRRPSWVGWNQWFALVVELLSLSTRARTKAIGPYAVDVGMRELVHRHAGFFRSSAHELEPTAFRLEMGDYPAAIESLVAWARHQSRGAV